ncbi:MAG: glycosyltransferase family 1 protein [Planctomycetes bacterium]|nr:glycosyltransferase family 1 protein [Planctomycetota bacterium]
MSFLENLRRNLADAPLHYRSWQARRDAGAERGGTYRVVVPLGVYNVYREHAEGLVDCLRALGRTAFLHPVKQLRHGGRLIPGDRVLAFAPDRLEPFKRAPGILYAAVNEEPYAARPDAGEDPPPRRSAGFLERCHLVFEANEALLEQAAELGLERAGVLPFGYSERWNWHAAPVKPRYDVAFLGRLATDHRRELWDAIRARFRVAPRNEAWGKQRARLLRAARIQLSLRVTEVPELAGHRFAMALANRCFLLSEPLPPGSPFQPGVHFAEATASSMIDRISRHLEHADPRAAIAARGHAFFRSEYRLETFVQRILPMLDFAMEAVREGREPESFGERRTDPAA